MCLRQPFQLLTSSPVPVKDNTCNNNENETFATNDKKQQQQKNSNWTKFQLLRQNERKTETNKVTNTCRIHQGTKGKPYHRTWENCGQNGVSRHTKKINGRAKA